MRGISISVFALSAACLWAQDSLGPTFRANTELVQVDVVVKANDVPVTGLTKDDFEVLDNGWRQTISVFSVRHADKAPAISTKLAPGVISNRPVYEGVDPVAATVILIDGLNTRMQDQSSVRNQVMHYLETSKRAEWIAIYYLHSKLDVRQNFTQDRDKLRTALEGMKPANETLEMTDRGQLTLNALKIVARAMQGLEGRKKLLWVTSANLPMMKAMMTRGGATTQDRYEGFEKEISDVFNAANVAVYPLDPRGGTAAVGRNPFGGLEDNRLEPMQHLAEATGGKTFSLDNDIGAGIQEAFEDTDLTYTLGFYPASDEAGGPHSVKVNMLREGVQARYRNQYGTADETKPEPTITDKSINSWVHLPVDLTDIQVQAEASPLNTKPGMYEVKIVVDLHGIKLHEVKGRFEGNVEVAITPDLDKEKLTGVRQTLKLSYLPDRLADVMVNSPTLTTIVVKGSSKGKAVAKAFHVVVMDQATGKAGSVRIPIEIAEVKPEAKPEAK